MNSVVLNSSQLSSPPQGLRSLLVDPLTRIDFRLGGGGIGNAARPAPVDAGPHRQALISAGPVPVQVQVATQVSLHGATSLVAKAAVSSISMSSNMVYIPNNLG